MPPRSRNWLLDPVPETNPLVGAGPTQPHDQRRARAPMGPPGAGNNPLLGQGAITGTIAPTPATAPAPMPTAPRAAPAPGTGSGYRISTRVPWAVGQPIDPHNRNDTLEVGLEASRASGDAYAKNADIIRGYDDIRTQRLKSPDAVHERLINHAIENLRFLHERMGSSFGDNGAIRERSKLWYDGANVIARRWAQEHGLQPHQVAGMLAALSPQTDWFQNVSRAERLLNIRRDMGNKAPTPEMLTAMQRLVDGQKKDKVRANLQGALDNIRNKTFNEIDDPYEMALYARAHEDVMAAKPGSTHAHYRVVTPEGEMADWAKTKAGKNAKIGWGSQGEITRAFEAMKNADLPSISRAMGSNHKVRNFYNNIIAPDHGDDVTIDTHAIAAAHLRPYAGEDFPVRVGLGLSGSSNASTGSKGLYGAYAEAYRRLANELGIKPRELQSITWEGLRGLFKPEQKRNEALVAAIDRHADDYKKGRIDGPTYRQRIHDAAGGIDRPEWARSNPAPDAGAQPPAGPGDLPSPGLPGRGAGAPGGRAGAGNPGAAPAAVGNPVGLDWTPGGGAKTAKIGPTTLDYGIDRTGETGELTLVKTPKEQRGQGHARAAVKQLTDEADRRGTTLFLNADPMDKGVSKSGLERLYRSHGFVKNMGKQKDFRSRAEFVRRPQKPSEG